MRRHSRGVGAIILMGLMVASLGVPPVIGQQTAFALDLFALSQALSRGWADIQDFDFLRKWDERVSVILELEGNPALASGAPELRVAQLKAIQAGLANEIAGRGGEVSWSYQLAYNGIAVSAPRFRLPALAALPGVSAIHMARAIEIDLETSVPFIGAPEVWDLTVDGVAVRGEGIKISIIDTGIDYTHAAYGGVGTPAAYTANDPDIIEAGSFPTDKVIGGFDFVGDAWGVTGFEPLFPDPDPLDVNGHGTLVGSVAAGFGVEGKVGEGVAPEALLFAWKVGGIGNFVHSPSVVAAIELSLDPNQDGDPEDRVDIISMSLGNEFGSEFDPLSVASNAAVDAGVIVVASAGNSGDVPYITGSPAVASGAISVAASHDDGIVFNAVRIDSPAELAGFIEAKEGAFTKPLAETGPISDELSFVGRGCLSPFDVYLDDPADKIALIDRGACRFDEKIGRAQAAGAVAAIIVNNVPGDPITMGGDPAGIDIPGVMIRLDDGGDIKDALVGSVVEVTLSAEFEFPKPELADTLAGFTSRGPGTTGSLLKPDITAPGVDIRGAAWATGDEGRLSSGTSFSAPHIAGVVALLRQLHPDWSVEEIKALIMNTATPTHILGTTLGNPAVLEGAGRVRADVAAHTTTVAVPGSLSFGVQAGSGSNDDVERELELRNKGTEDKTFEVFGFLPPIPGLSLDIDEDEVEVDAGDEEEIEVEIEIDFDVLPRLSTLPEVEGEILILQVDADSTPEELRVPFYVIPIPTSEVEADDDLELEGDPEEDVLEVENDGVFPADVHFFALGSTDAEEPEITNEHDLRAVGARSFFGGFIIEFGVATEGRWSTPNQVQFQVWMDVGPVPDGIPDFILFNIDLGLFFIGQFLEAQITVLFDLSTGAFIPQFFIDVGGTYNQASMGLPVFGPDIGIPFATTTLEYAVVAFGDIPPFDVVSPSGLFLFPGISFDAGDPPVTTFPSDLFGLAEDEEAEVPIFLGGTFGSMLEPGLLLLLPFDDPDEQFIVVSFDDDDDDGEDDD